MAGNILILDQLSELQLDPSASYSLEPYTRSLAGPSSVTKYPLNFFCFNPNDLELEGLAGLLFLDLAGNLAKDFWASKSFLANPHLTDSTLAESDDSLLLIDLFTRDKGKAAAPLTWGRGIWGGRSVSQTIQRWARLSYSTFTSTNTRQSWARLNNNNITSTRDLRPCLD